MAVELRAYQQRWRMVVANTYLSKVKQRFSEAAQKVTGLRTERDKLSRQIEQAQTEAEAAQARMAKGGHIGKILLNVAG